MSNNNYPLTGFLVTAILGQLVASMYYSGRISEFSSFTQFHEVLDSERAMNAVVAATDTLIAVVLIYLLLKQRTDFKKTNGIINRLIIYTVGTGLVTAVWCIVGLIGTIVMPESFIYLLVDIVVCKCKTSFNHFRISLTLRF